MHCMLTRDKTMLCKVKVGCIYKLLFSLQTLHWQVFTVYALISFYLFLYGFYVFLFVFVAFLCMLHMWLPLGVINKCKGHEFRNSFGFRLDALALSVIATATWLGGWLGAAVCHSRYCSKTTKPIRKLFGPSGRPII